MGTTLTVSSPCLHCNHVCFPLHKSRCSAFLEYIQDLHRNNGHHILISELKSLIVKTI